MHYTEECRREISAIVEEVSREFGLNLRLKPQRKIKSNLSVLGGIGRLRIKPVKKYGYRVGLSDKKITAEMEGFMIKTFGEKDGYAQKGEREPYWKVSDLQLIEKIIRRYADVARK